MKTGYEFEKNFLTQKQTDPQSAFTLAEVMVTLVVLGILASILMPIVKNLYPDKQKVMFRKGYYIAERIVYEVVNDEELYPSKEGKIGLDNVMAVPYLGQTFGDSDSSNSDAAKAKFCKLFSEKVNVSDYNAIACDSNHAVPQVTGNTRNAPSFTTTDGIAWYLPISNFESATPSTFYRVIYIDVNGDLDPNCQYNASTCPKPDTFEINVRADGKIFVTGEKEKEYLKHNTSVQSKND